MWKVRSSRPDPPQASQVLLQPLGAAALCQEQVYRAAARRLLCLLKTRPRAIGALGSNAAAPAPPLSSSRRIFPCRMAAWVDELAQDLDERHVRSSSSSSPPRNAHAVVRRRLVDFLFLFRGSFKVATNNRGHAPRRGNSPRATQGLLRHSAQTLPDHLGFIISSIGKEPYGFQRGDALRSVVKRACCCSRQPRIVVS